MIFIMIFLLGSSLVALVLSRGVYAASYEYSLLHRSKMAYFTTEASLEEMAYRYINFITTDSVETIVMGDSVATTTVTYEGLTDTYTFNTVGENSNVVRNGTLALQVTSGVSFSYGIQSGQGGIELKNSSSILGSIYSNGTVVGAGNMVYGDVISAGPGGLVEDIHATGSVWAHTIKDSTVDGDAYAYTIDGGIVGGTGHYFNKINGAVIGTDPGGNEVIADKATATFPVSDEVIALWEAEAEAGGVYSGACPYSIDYDTDLGPIKIPCDLIIDKNNTEVTLQGPVWVEGNFTTLTGPTIQIDSSFPDTIIPIIADDQSDRVTSSKVDINNSTEFIGAAGTSHVMVISMNNDDEENGGTEVAINGGQSGSGDLVLYAPHGRAVVANNGSFTELTAYTIELQNSVQVIFDQGLINPAFTGSPSASFVISDWNDN